MSWLLLILTSKANIYRLLYRLEPVQTGPVAHSASSATGTEAWR